MSKVLMIRHLPVGLSIQDKEQLLKTFGADKVWEKANRRYYVFASFPNLEQAKSSLLRLHQLEIGGRRLVVEYSRENEPISTKTSDEQSSTTSKFIKEFLRVLNAWNPSVNFYQPPPTHLKYKYPDYTPETAINIIYNLYKHKPFYVQTLHLMNKMCLASPFEVNAKATDYFQETYSNLFINDTIHRIPRPPSEPESELSSDENIQDKPSAPTVVKRLHTLPKTRKRLAAVLSTAQIPQTKKKPPAQQEEIFEGLQTQEPKKISLVIHQDALQKSVESEQEVVGELGKFDKEKTEEEVLEPETIPEKPTITRQELIKNRISYSDMKVLPVFKNYHPGQPSMRLYIKNLAKTTTEQDVKRIYRRYIEKLCDDDQQGFDVRVMQEGRMKGQAFVTFPTVKLAETALNETNGFMLNEKPMVVQFARVANKKPIE